VNFYGKLRHFLNAAKVNQLGTGSLLSCRIERRKKGGVISIGEGSVISGFLITETENSRIEIGNNVFIGGKTILDCVEHIVIEDDVLISYGCLQTATTIVCVMKSESMIWPTGEMAESMIGPVPVPNPFALKRGYG